MLMSDKKLSIREIQWAIYKLVLEKIMCCSINTWIREDSWMKLRADISQKDKLE